MRLACAGSSAAALDVALDVALVVVSAWWIVRGALIAQASASGTEGTNEMAHLVSGTATALAARSAGYGIRRPRHGAGSGVTPFRHAEAAQPRRSARTAGRSTHRCSAKATMQLTARVAAR